MEKAQNKLKQILDLVSYEDKEKLRKELTKMVPVAENSTVTTKVGWGHYDDSVHTSISFYVNEYKKLEEKFNLSELYEGLIKKIKPDEQSKLVESFDVILSKKPKKVTLKNLPSMEIFDKTRAIFTSFEVPL